jgi:ATP-dependent exoDNAse (exonuclease V) alpha subunit
MFRDVGWSAIPIGGTTIHRATGIGIPRTTKAFDNMWKEETMWKWRHAKVWIIDEISMVSAEMLDHLEHKITEIRNVPKPFGGLQVWCNTFTLIEKISRHSSQMVISHQCSYRSYLQVTFFNCIRC